FVAIEIADCHIGERSDGHEVWESVADADIDLAASDCEEIEITVTVEIGEPHVAQIALRNRRRKCAIWMAEQKACRRSGGWIGTQGVRLPVFVKTAHRKPDRGTTAGIERAGERERAVEILQPALDAGICENDEIHPPVVIEVGRNNHQTGWSRRDVR